MSSIDDCLYTACLGLLLGVLIGYGISDVFKVIPLREAILSHGAAD
jgi:hypothetical protein